MFINHLICSCVISLGDLSSFVWGFCVFKWKCIFATEQSKYGLFVVLWINSKPDLKHYMAECWGGVEDGEVSGALLPAAQFLRARPSAADIPCKTRVILLGSLCSFQVGGDGRSWSRGPGSTGGQVGGARSGLVVPCSVCLAWRRGVLRVPGAGIHPRHHQCWLQLWQSKL